jgi:hypothetical protein
MTTEHSEPSLNPKALAAFLLGLLALPLNLLAGLPALLLGFSGLREIHRADGRLRGRWMAIAGIVLGGFILVADVLALGGYLIVQVRQASYRAECSNRLRLMGMAVSLYQEQHTIYPPGTIPNPDLPPERRLSWLVSLLPYYVERESKPRRAEQAESIFQTTWEGVDRTNAWDDEANRPATSRLLHAFLCPAHPAFREEPTAGPTYYVGIAGLGRKAAELPVSDPASGMFGYDRTNSPADLTAGASYTMMVTETAWCNGPWAAGGFATVRGLDPQEIPYLGKGRPFGGLHPHIVNILYADSTVRPFADDASAAEFARMATIGRSPEE